MLGILMALAAAQASPGASLIDRNRADRAPVRPTPTRRARPVEAATAVAADAPTITITGIRFSGVDAPRRVAAAGRRFLGRKAARQTLTELAAALAAAYRHTDVALYTVAIPGQDFTDGVVEIRLIEGRIAGIDFGAPAGPQLRGRLTPLVGGTLSRTTFERQLTLARAIPGLTLAADVADPAGTGALRLNVTPTQRRHKLTAGYTSRGVDLLGAGQLNADAEFYGVLRDGDQASAGLAAAPDLKRFRLATAGYVAPIGASGLSAALSGAYLETRPRGRAGKGTAKQLAASLSYPLVRSFTAAADLSLSVDGVDSDDATIAGVVARERSRAARLAIGYSRNGERRSWSVAAAGSRGLGLFGAQAPGSKPRFNKLTATASVGQAIGRRVTARASASGQYSRDPLPAVERFAIGGEAIGRAFDEALLSGDRGGGGLAELAWRPLGKGKFSTSELYSFVDGGIVRVLARPGIVAQRYSLASAGLGGRFRRGDKAELGVEAARVIDRPYPAYRDDWQLTASWRLKL